MLHFIPNLMRIPDWLHRTPRARSVLYHKHFERVLGTVLELQIRASSLEVARKAETALLAEIDRLECVFSRFMPDSQLGRWQGNEGEQNVSLELGELLRNALHWMDFTRGAFNPASDALGQVWKAAERLGVAPSSEQLTSVLESLKSPLYCVSKDARTATRLSDVPLNFNAIAKGWIADLACSAAFALEGVTKVMVNLGCDLRHQGDSGLEVAIAHPFSSVDNAPPITRVRIQNQAVATSGGSRQGFQVGAEWFSHVLDPRTGLPAHSVASASVLADECSVADVLATAFSVLEPLESLELADSLARVGCLLVSSEGTVYSNAFWKSAMSDEQ